LHGAKIFRQGLYFGAILVTKLRFFHVCCRRSGKFIRLNSPHPNPLPKGEGTKDLRRRS
jgi:hypothetical protein